MSICYRSLKKRIAMNYIPRVSSVDLFLTYNCNCKCSYCYLQGSGSDISMEPYILDKSIDWIVRHAGNNIRLLFTGGEPTLEANLIERAVHRCRNWEKHYPVAFTFTMTTNALNIDEKLAEKLARWGVHYLLSIDGYGERHNKSRPARFTKNPFGIIQSCFPILKKYQKNITARLTVLPSLVRGLYPDLVKLQQLGFNNFVIWPAVGVHWSKENFQNYIEEIVTFASKRSIKNGCPVPRISPIDDPVQRKGTSECVAGRGRLSIDPRGKIFACARLVHLNEEDGLPLGDIFQGIKSDGNIKEFQETAYTNRLECINCSIREKCLGSCPALNWETNQSLIKPALEGCRIMHVHEEIRQQVHRKSIMTV